eukprot:2742912-Prymnesium_polylepis.1
MPCRVPQCGTHPSRGPCGIGVGVDFEKAIDPLTSGEAFVGLLALMHGAHGVHGLDPLLALLRVNGVGVAHAHLCRLVRSW